MNVWAIVHKRKLTLTVNEEVFFTVHENPANQMPNVIHSVVSQRIRKKIVHANDAKISV